MCRIQQKNWKVYNAWVGRIKEEFYSIGDKEREAGLPVTDIFDKEKPIPLPKFQLGFITYIVKPLYTLISDTNVFDLKEPLKMLGENETRWQKLKLEDEKKKIAEASLDVVKIEEPVAGEMKATPDPEPVAEKAEELDLESKEENLELGPIPETGEESNEKVKGIRTSYRGSNFEPELVAEKTEEPAAEWTEGRFPVITPAQMPKLRQSMMKMARKSGDFSTLGLEHGETAHLETAGSESATEKAEDSISEVEKITESSLSPQDEVNEAIEILQAVLSYSGNDSKNVINKTQSTNGDASSIGEPAEPEVVDEKAKESVAEVTTSTSSRPGPPSDERTADGSTDPWSANSMQERRSSSPHLT